MKGVFSELDLRVLADDGMFEVINNPCIYIRGLFKYTVHPGFKTDLASIPRLLRGIFKRNGKSRKPAVFHDHMIKTKWKTRKQADKEFHQMLLDQGMDPWKAKIYYWGVCIGTWKAGDYADAR